MKKSVSFDPATMPSVGDTISVEWCSEPWHRMTWRAMYSGIVTVAPDDGEYGIWCVYYPSNELALYFGKHPGLTVWQNLEKLSWKWASPPDDWEYRAHCEMTRARHGPA